MCINYFLISARLSNTITSDNRDPNNALNSDMGVVWGLLCLHPNTIKSGLQIIFLSVHLKSNQIREVAFLEGTVY